MKQSTPWVVLTTAFHPAADLDKVSASATVDSGSIPSQITENGIHSFLALMLSNYKGQCEVIIVCGRRMAAAWFKDKFPCIAFWLKQRGEWCNSFMLHPQQISKIKIKSIIVLTVLRRSVWRVCGGHLRVIAPVQHSFFRRNLTVVAVPWQHCVQFDQPKIWFSILLPIHQLCGLVWSSNVVRENS